MCCVCMVQSNHNKRVHGKCIFNTRYCGVRDTKSSIVIFILKPFSFILVTTVSLNKFHGSAFIHAYSCTRVGWHWKIIFTDAAQSAKTAKIKLHKIKALYSIAINFCSVQCS